MKVAKRKLRVYEVPISYHGRTYEEGKKIGWRDGVKALGVVLRFWLIDDLYSEPYGRAFLNNLTGTPQYLNWLTRILRPYVRNTVLEIGAGIGNLSARLMARRLRYVAAESDPLYLHALQNRFLRTPHVSVRRLQPDAEPDYATLRGQFDTVLCVNVLEYAAAPETVLRLAATALQPGGRILVLAPQGAALYSPLDERMGHRRRFHAAELKALLERCGFAIRETRQLNKAGAPAWWFFGKVLRRRKINKLTLKIFDKTVWLWRLLDPLLPWRGLSLVVVAEKP
jgi:SAM-dependent methyltransferase